MKPFILILTVLCATTLHASAELVQARFKNLAKHTVVVVTLGDGSGTYRVEPQSEIEKTIPTGPTTIGVEDSEGHYRPITETQINSPTKISVSALGVVQVRLFDFTVKCGAAGAIVTLTTHDDIVNPSERTVRVPPNRTSVIAVENGAIVDVAIEANGQRTQIQRFEMKGPASSTLSQ